MVELRRLPRRFATLGNDRVAYVDLGEGPLILCLHGLGGNADRWQPLLARLPQHYRIVAIDLLGFGYSARPHRAYDLRLHCAAILAVLRRIGVAESTALLGHGLGGSLAITLLGAGWITSERLALLNAPFLAPDMRLLAHRRRQFAIELALRFRAFAQLALSGARFAQTIRSRLMPPEERPYEVQIGRFDYSAESYTSTARDLLLSSDLRPWLTRIQTQPTLIVQSRHDRQVPLAHAARLVRALPQARHHLIDGDHYAPLDHAIAPLVQWVSGG